MTKTKSGGIPEGLSDDYLAGAIDACSSIYTTVDKRIGHPVYAVVVKLPVNGEMARVVVTGRPARDLMRRLVDKLNNPDKVAKARVFAAVDEQGVGSVDSKISRPHLGNAKIVTCFIGCTITRDGKWETHYYQEMDRRDVTKEVMDGGIKPQVVAPPADFPKFQKQV